PDEPAGHYQLGRLLLARSEIEPGLASLHQAQRLEPARARAYIAEAQWLASHGKTVEAIAKAREGTYAEPSSAAARTLLDGLTTAKPGAGSGSGLIERDDP
ncbi:MAG: hypothetical protein H0T79_20850, partial [Deltaproteobacteria bacterium]|nr:hypothetical protein [Deltaproteobacteria bacterium]